MINYIYVCREHLASLVVQSSLTTGNTPRLTRRATYKAVTIRNLFRINRTYISKMKDSGRMILDIGLTGRRFEFIGPNHLKSCLFKTQVKTTASGKKRHYLH